MKRKAFRFRDCAPCSSPVQLSRFGFPSTVAALATLPAGSEVHLKLSTDATTAVTTVTSVSVELKSAKGGKH